MIFSAGQSGIIRVWSIPETKKYNVSSNLIHWHAHTDSIWDLQYHQNKDMLISSSADGTNKLWLTFKHKFELCKGKLLNSFSYKKDMNFYYDIPTCVCWQNDHLVNS